MYVTEMTFIIHFFQLTFGCNTCRLGEFIVYITFNRNYVWCQKCSFQMRVVKRKPLPENGGDLSHQFLEHVSWVVMLISNFFINPDIEP